MPISEITPTSLVSEAQKLSDSPHGNNNAAFCFAWHALMLLAEDSNPALFNQANALVAKTLRENKSVSLIKAAEEHVLLAQHGKSPLKNIQLAMAKVSEAKEKLSVNLKVIFQYFRDNQLDIPVEIRVLSKMLIKAEHLNLQLDNLIADFSEKSGGCYSQGALGKARGAAHINQAKNYLKLSEILLAHKQSVDSVETNDIETGEKGRVQRKSLAKAEEAVKAARKSFDVAYKATNWLTRAWSRIKNFFRSGQQNKILTNELSGYKACKPSEGEIANRLQPFSEGLLPAQRLQRLASTSTIASSLQSRAPSLSQSRNSQESGYGSGSVSHRARSVFRVSVDSDVSGNSDQGVDVLDSDPTFGEPAVLPLDLLEGKVRPPARSKFRAGLKHPHLQWMLLTKGKAVVAKTTVDFSSAPFNVTVGFGEGAVTKGHQKPAVPGAEKASSKSAHKAVNKLDEPYLSPLAPVSIHFSASPNKISSDGILPFSLTDPAVLTA